MRIVIIVGVLGGIPKGEPLLVHLYDGTHFRMEHFPTADMPPACVQRTAEAVHEFCATSQGQHILAK